MLSLLLESQTNIRISNAPKAIHHSMVLQCSVYTYFNFFFTLVYEQICFNGLNFPDLQYSVFMWSRCSSASLYYMTQTKDKKWERPGNEDRVIFVSKIVICYLLYQRTCAR